MEHIVNFGISFDDEAIKEDDEIGTDEWER